MNKEKENKFLREGVAKKDISEQQLIEDYSHLFTKMQNKIKAKAQATEIRRHLRKNLDI